MEYVNLAGSDLRVSPVCIGCWQFNGGQQSPDKTWPAQPEEVSKSIVDKALELGVNFFDTAEAYLNSEVVVGRLLQGRRKNVILASKFGARTADYTPEEIEVSLNKSLKNLQTDYIDLYQVHWPNHLTKNLKACIDELNRQQAKGRIRYYSVCNYGPNNLKEFIAAGGKPITNQVSYNLLWRPVEYEILPVCIENNVDVLPYSALQQGLLSGRFLKAEDVPEGRRRTRFFTSESTDLSRHGGKGAEAETFQAIHRIKEICEEAGLSMPVSALSWLLHQPPVKSVIVGARNPEQVEANVKTVKLSQDVLRKLDDATKDLKEMFGPNPDLWAPKSRMA